MLQSAAYWLLSNYMGQANFYKFVYKFVSMQDILLANFLPKFAYIYTERSSCRNCKSYSAQLSETCKNEEEYEYSVNFCGQSPQHSVNISRGQSPQHFLEVPTARVMNNLTSRYQKGKDWQRRDSPAPQTFHIAIQMHPLTAHYLMTALITVNVRTITSCKLHSSKQLKCSSIPGLRI
jgi:hypothetical protein